MQQKDRNSSPDSANPLSGWQRQQILIVDDVEANLFALKKVLKAVDADVVEAQSGQEALSAVLNHDFSLIILDVQMPNMDGYELAGYLRGDPKTTSVPIIFLTANYVEEESVFRGYESGAIDYITKPYMPRILISKVKILLEMDRDKHELMLHRDRLADLVDERVAELDQARLAALNMMEDAVLSKTKLHEALQRQRSHIEHTPLAAIEIDANWNICAWNPAAEKIFGWQADEVIGKNVDLIVAHEDKAFVGQQMESLYNRTGGFLVTNHNITKDNRIILCEWYNTVLTDEDGTVSGVASLAMDITERHNIQEQLRHNATNLQSTIDVLRYDANSIQEFLDYALNKAIELTDSTIGYIYFYNEETQQFTLNSWSGEVMKQCAVRDPQTTYDLNKTGLWGEAVRQRKPILVNDFQAENPLKKGTPQGHVQLESFLTVPVFQGDKIVAVIGVANKDGDYTDDDILHLELLMDSVWKTAENMRVTEVIQKSEEQYRALFTNMSSGFSQHRMIYDEQGDAVDYDFIQVNPAFEMLTGLKAADVIGQTVLDVLPDIEPEWIDIYSQVVKTGEPVEFERYSRESNRYYFVRVFRTDPDIFAVVFDDITERQQAQKDLEDSQLLLRNIIDTIHNRVWWKDLDSRFLGCNISFAKDAGYNHPDQIIGKTDYDMCWKDEANHFVADDRGVIQSGKPKLRIEESQTRADGRVRWLETNKIPLTDAQGNIIGTVGTYADITERKSMEEALEKRIIALTRPLDDDCVIEFKELFDLEEIQRMQDEFAEATGVASIITQTDGTPITEPSHFTNLCKLIRKTEKGCANCFKSDAALGQVKTDGPSIQPCLSGGLWDAGASITVGGKHIANWVIGQVRDKTQTEDQMRANARELGIDEAAYIKAFHKVPSMSKKRFEAVAQALFTMTNQLSTSAYQNMQQARFIADEKRRSAELLRLSTAINQSPEAIVITDTQGHIEYVNPAFEIISGYSHDEAISQTPSILKSGQHSSSFYKDLWKTISKGDVWSGRFINKRKDGSLYTEESVISPVKSPDGIITNYVAVKRDITNELIQEEHLQNAQKMEAIGQLAGGIAHDFNNILQAILGFSELLLLTLDSELETPRKNVTAIQKAAHHATELTRQLLAFSRKQTIELSKADVNQAVQNTISFITSIIGENVQIKTELDPNLKPVLADLQQLERVLLNIGLNARDAMPNGGILTIRTEATRLSTNDAERSTTVQAGEFICLSISDTGTGMSEKIRNHIFEPFFTTKAPGKGTGLGLSAVYGIIQKHKGWIDVTSAQDEGSTFKIYLPICKDKESPVIADRNNPDSSQGHGQGERILIVEDDPAVLNLAKNTLLQAGYNVETASSAAEAEALFKAADQPFDLLFTDVFLPVKNGVELQKTLIKKQPDLNVLFFSAYPEDQLKRIGLDNTVSFFLEKPFSIIKLLKIVDCIFTQKQTKA